MLYIKEDMMKQEIIHIALVVDNYDDELILFTHMKTLDVLRDTQDDVKKLRLEITNLKSFIGIQEN